MARQLSASRTKLGASPGAEWSPGARRSACAPVTLLALVVILVLIEACGSSSVTPDLPSPSATPPPGGFVVSITSAGVSPQTLHVWEGRKAAFVNDDSLPHAVFGDPHPAHTGCAGMLNIGTLAPGERREIANLPVDACFYHDEGNPANMAFRGLVLVH